MKPLIFWISVLTLTALTVYGNITRRSPGGNDGGVRTNSIWSTTAPAINQVRTNSSGYRLLVSAVVWFNPDEILLTAEFFTALDGHTNHCNKIVINDGPDAVFDCDSFEFPTGGWVAPNATYWVTNYNYSPSFGCGGSSPSNDTTSYLEQIVP
jgi:hypothetical protein